MYTRVRGRPLVVATIVVAALGVLLLDPGMISHFPGAAEPNDLATQSGMGGAFWGAFPDLAHTIDFMVAEGDRVSTRLTLTANGISCIVDGKLTEQWVEFDSMSLMMEIGAGPI
jgi:hypothetical protein